MNDQRPGPGYAAKLADPRWQKVAAEIKIRDGWECVVCGNGLEDGVPLEVHHLHYVALEPWNEPRQNLQTRCANCHGTSPPEAIDPEEYRARLGLWAQKFSELNRQSVELLAEARALGVWK